MLLKLQPEKNRQVATFMFCYAPVLLLAAILLLYKISSEVSHSVSLEHSNSFRNRKWANRFNCNWNVGFMYDASRENFIFLLIDFWSEKYELVATWRWYMEPAHRQVALLNRCCREHDVNTQFPHGQISIFSFTTKIAEKGKIILLSCRCIFIFESMQIWSDNTV